VNAQQIEAAVAAAGLAPLPTGASAGFAKYLALLLKWNAKLNLTAIREPSAIVERHFLECIQCAQVLPAASTLLDFGSGGGFPGIPIALLRPGIEVTLGESQAKKAAFLREAVRTLGLEVSIFDDRIETMDPSRRFQAVTLRAVDKMAEACSRALERLAAGGWLVVFATSSTEAKVKNAIEDATGSRGAVSWVDSVALVGRDDAFLMLGRKTVSFSVPRGT
jgi:16S rRNA (guanine527-N7)-methyltransferase